jgi:hypothetical protein
MAWILKTTALAGLGALPFCAVAIAIPMEQGSRAPNRIERRQMALEQSHPLPPASPVLALSAPDISAVALANKLDAAEGTDFVTAYRTRISLDRRARLERRVADLE